MASKCECARDYLFLVDSLDLLIEAGGTSAVDLAAKHLANAVETTKEVAVSCGVDVSPIESALAPLPDDLASLLGWLANAAGREYPTLVEFSLKRGAFTIPREALEKIPGLELAAAAEGGEMIKVKNLQVTGQLLKATGKTVEDARAALRTAEGVLDKCTTEECSCAKGELSLKTANEGIRTAAQNNDVADLTAIAAVLPTTIASTAEACEIPPPPKENVDEILRRVDVLRKLGPGIEKGLHEEAAKRIKAAESPGFPGKLRGETFAVEDLAELLAQSKKDWARLPPEEKAERLEFVARMRAMNEELRAARTATVEMGALVEFGQGEEPPVEPPVSIDIDDYLRMLGIAPATETGRSVLDVKQDPEFIEAATRVGFTPEQLATIPADKWRSLYAGVRAELVTAGLSGEKLETARRALAGMTLPQLLEVAARHPEKVRSTEELRQDFLRRLKERGLRETFVPGPILREPFEITAGVKGKKMIQIVHPQFLRGPPVKKYERVTGPPGLPCKPEREAAIQAKRGADQAREKIGLAQAVLDLMACEAFADKRGQSLELECKAQRDRVEQGYREVYRFETVYRKAEGKLVKCFGPTLSATFGLPRKAVPTDVLPDPEMRRFEEARDTLLQAAEDVALYLDAGLGSCAQAEQITAGMRLLELS